MKKYTVLISGLAATASTSFWYSFGFHPQIVRSRNKEIYMYFLRLKNKNSKYIPFTYNSLYEETKILLDGSVYAAHDENFINFIKETETVNRICCIFRIRPSEERLFSHISVYIKKYLDLKRDDERPGYINRDKSIDYDVLKVSIEDILNEYDVIMRTINLLGKENIFIGKIEEMFTKQKQIFDFLEIDSTIVVPSIKLNSRKNIYFDNEHFKLMEQIKQFYFDNHTYFSKISDFSNEQIFRNLQLQ